jgi:iron complex transport system substrate-binding protein
LNNDTGLISIPTFEDVTRRTFITGALASAFLIACGDGEDEEAAPEATAAPTTRMVTHALGTTEVPVSPQRVVVTDNNALPYILELGVVPIAAGTLQGSYNGKDFHPALYAMGAEKTVAYSRDLPDYELVVSLQPDLIVGSTFSLLNRVQDGAATYGKLAPLAAVDSDLPIFEQIRGYGRILNREKQADELIAKFQDSIRGIAGRVSVEKLSIARAFGDSQLFIYTKLEPFTALWVDLLGIGVIPGTEGVAKTGTIIAAAERMGDLQGDALVVIQGIERLETNPLWPLLPAVKAGHVHHVGDYLTYAGNGGLNALREQILGIANFLADIK